MPAQPVEIEKTVIFFSGKMKSCQKLDLLPGKPITEGVSHLCPEYSVWKGT